MKLGYFAWNGFGYGSLIGLLVVGSVLLQSGCGSSDATGKPEATGGSTGSTGGVAPGGNGGASNGGASNGGASNGGNVGTGGATDSCNAKVVDPTKYSPCDSCTGGRCVPKSDFPDAPSDILAACGADQLCLPDNLVESKGNVLLGKCDSIIGNEGRCASLCIPVVRDLSGVLPQGQCPNEERCAPCFNPNDGSPTGICDIGCDKGPTTQPILFTKCCGGRGDCIPRASIPGNAGKNLAPETCTGANDPVCVPAAIVANPTYRFPACDSSVSVIPGTPGTSQGPGVCVPKCIVDSTQFGKNINQGSCADPTDKCVPCTNPTNGQPSGACIE